jgi:hypothetical protein
MQRSPRIQDLETLSQNDWSQKRMECDKNPSICHHVPNSHPPPTFQMTATNPTIRSILTK